MVLPDVKPAPVGLPVGNNYIAFVIDTSGSMRDPNHGGLWPIAIRTIENVLDVYPNIDGIQLLDGDGRFILQPTGHRHVRLAGRHPGTRDINQARPASLRSGHGEQSRARHLQRDAFSLTTRRTRRCAWGSSCSATNSTPAIRPTLVIRRLDELNPADENGNRRVTINAVGFPTTIRYQFSMGNTGLRFANLMRTVTYLHGGAFIACRICEATAWRWSRKTGG